jgi:asparagine synthase (glutamine-hydrolysing)
MEGRSLFEGVHVLHPAAAWTFRRGALERTGSYFSPAEWEAQPELDPHAFDRELRGVVSRTLPRYFDADERIAVSLTGGLDTRIIMAWQKNPPGSLPCYTFGGMYRDCHDVRVARQVAVECRQPHEVIPVGGEFLARFPHYAERSVYLTDGCVDVSHSADLFLNERAREIAPIRMTGNYGGEVLRRVVAFKPERPLPDLFQPELLQHVPRAVETFDRSLTRHPVSFAVFHQAPWHHYGLLALEQTQVTLRSPYLDNELVRTVFRAPHAALDTADTSLRLIAHASPALAQLRTDRGLADARGRLAARVSRALIVYQRKAEYAFDYGMPQWLACFDRVLSGIRLERIFLGRHKFCHYRVWYRDVLSGYVQDVLLDPRALARPYLNRRAVEGIVRAHLRGYGNYTSEIHKLLTLELVHRLFVDC